MRTLSEEEFEEIQEAFNVAFNKLLEDNNIDPESLKFVSCKETFKENPKSVEVIRFTVKLEEEKINVSKGY